MVGVVLGIHLVGAIVVVSSSWHAGPPLEVLRQYVIGRFALGEGRHCSGGTASGGPAS